MRKESNRVSCSSRDENGQERWRWWLLFVVYGVTNTTEELESLEICWLKERERSKTKPRFRVDAQERIG